MKVNPRKCSECGEALEDGSKFCPNCPQPVARRFLRSADKLAVEGKNKEAIEDYTRAIEIDPEFGYAYNNRGIAHAALGHGEQAIED